MANTKGSALTADTSLGDTDSFIIVDYGVSPITTKKVTYSVLEAAVRDATIITDLSTVTAAAGDFLLVLDVSASPQALKKVLVSDLLDNATHTGDVTGSGALTIQPEAISGKGAVTASGSDYVLILDTSTSPHSLAKALVSDLGSAFGVSDITGAGAITVAGGDLLVAVDASASPQVLGQVTAQAVADLFDASGYLPLSGGTLTGSIAFAASSPEHTVDGRNVSADGAKLDTIETNADVTDTANVTAAGALMDSEVTNLAAVKAFDPTDYATAAQGATADSALQNVVEDTTPELGGNLAAGGNNITDLGDVTFKTGAAGGTLRTGTSNADKFTLQAYDVDGSSYVTLLEADAGNDVRLQIPTGPLDFEDSTDNTKIMNLDLSSITTATTRTITMPDSDVNLGDIATNNAKVTNATHTGDATGSGALTLQPVAISGKGGITVASADEVLVVDASASPQVLGKTTAGAIADLFSLSVTDITGQAADSPMAAGTGDLLLAVNVSTSPWRLVQVTADSIAALGGGGDLWSDAVDADIVPTGADSTYDLGTTTDRFAQTYTDTIWITDGDVTTSVADGATAVAFDFNNTITLSTAGAKLLSLKNNGSEKAYITKDGGAMFGTVNSVDYSNPYIAIGGDTDTGIVGGNGTVRFACNGSQGGSVNTAGFGTAYSVYAGGSTPDGTGLSIKNGTEPSGQANQISIYSKDSSDGTTNATIGIRTEQTVEAIGTFTASHKLKIWINGVEYWIQLDAV